MKKVTIRRIFSYIIDYIIIAVVSSLFANIAIINPNYEEYQEKYNNYTEILGETLSNSDTESLEDISYELSKSGIYVSIINLTITFGYFVVFQYFNKGQTIGKKLLKVKVKDVNNERVRFSQILIHSLIINSIVTSLLSVVAIASLSKVTFLKLNSIIQLIDMGLVFVSIGFMLFREDGRGLHDMIANTIVVRENE